MVGQAANNVTIIENHVGQNHGDGLSISAPAVYVDSNRIGIKDDVIIGKGLANESGQFLGNGGHVVRVHVGSCFATITNTYVDGNQLLGTRDDRVLRHADLPLLNVVLKCNETGLSACTICRCVSVKGGKTEVDCSQPIAPPGADTNTSAAPPPFVNDFGPVFLTEFPAKMIALRMHKIDLQRVDFAALKAAKGLRLLDISGNTDDFPKLSELCLSQTNLAALTNRTFGGLKANLEAQEGPRLGPNGQSSTALAASRRRLRPRQRRGEPPARMPQPARVSLSSARRGRSPALTNVVFFPVFQYQPSSTDRARPKGKISPNVGGGDPKCRRGAPKWARLRRKLVF